jgi:hypothetical protein
MMAVGWVGLAVCGCYLRFHTATLRKLPQAPQGFLGCALSAFRSASGEK